MKHIVAAILLVIFLCAGKSQGAAAPIAPLGDVLTLKTPEGLRFGIWGTKVRYPAPVPLSWVSRHRTIHTLATKARSGCMPGLVA